MITVKNLTFEYPGVRALDDVSIEIPGGEITALVGPNGAGKTTLMRCLAALETPISGSIIVDGIDVLDEPRECHRKVGYLADFYGLYEALTVKQCLSYFACAQLIPADRQKAAVLKAAQRLNIEDRLEQKAGTLSRGLSQRLAIAQAIIHEPKLIILDEPAAGLDPDARHKLSELFLELKSQGMTLLVSSHILSELEEYTDHMVIVRDGKINQFSDVKHSIRDSVLIHIQTHQAHDNIPSLLSQFSGVSDIICNNNNIHFKFISDAQKKNELIRHLINANISICEFHEETTSLHETYMAQVSNADLKGQS